MFLIGWFLGSCIFGGWTLWVNLFFAGGWKFFSTQMTQILMDLHRFFFVWIFCEVRKRTKYKHEDMKTRRHEDTVFEKNPVRDYSSVEKDKNVNLRMPLGMRTNTKSRCIYFDKLNTSPNGMLFVDVAYSF